MHYGAHAVLLVWCRGRKERQCFSQVENVSICEHMYAITKVHCIKGGYTAAEYCRFPLTLIDLLPQYTELIGLVSHNVPLRKLLSL